MSKQALESEKVSSGLKDVLLGLAQLCDGWHGQGNNTVPNLQPQASEEQVAIHAV
jgi:hypothetical protein